jgi:citronellyl-CoA synthetase
MKKSEGTAETYLINQREFNKRYRKWLRKHNDTIQKLTEITRENKLSWGSFIEEAAIKYANNIAVKFEDEELTYKQFNESVNQFANYFLSLGLKKGETIEVILPNRIEYLIIFSAAGKIGAVASLINIDLREKSLIHSIKLTPGKIIIVDEECFEYVNQIKDQLDLKEDQILLFLPNEGKIATPETFNDLSEAVKECSKANPSTTLKVRTKDPLANIFTSGTTGLSKASILIHNRMIGGALFFGQTIAEITPDDTIYIPLPSFHSNALTIGWASAFSGGGAVAISKKFSVTRFWDEVRKFKATAFIYVGEICRYLYNQPPSDNDLDNNLRIIIGNGLRQDIWMQFKKRFGIAHIGEFYGASEISPVFANILNFDYTVGGCGNPYAIIEYDIEEDKPIRDKKGFMKRVPLGGVGLLIFDRSDPNIFVGYTNKEATEKKLFRNVFQERDVWFNSGDLMRDLGQSHAQFIDRLGDTFRWKGHNVSTTEVEEIVNIFPDILLSSVYGIIIPGTDGRAGMASIVPSVKLKDFDFKALYNHLEKNLASYAIPIFLRFKSDFETTSTLKFKKNVLKREGFDLTIINDPLYILLPRKKLYIPLTAEIYENLQNYKF